MDEFYTNLGHSHNGFVDVQLEIGIAGLTLYCLCLIYPLMRLCFKLKNRNPIIEVKIMLIVFLFVYSFSGSSFMRPNTMLFMIFFYTSFDILREKNERLYNSK